MHRLYVRMQIPLGFKLHGALVAQKPMNLILGRVLGNDVFFQLVVHSSFERTMFTLKPKLLFRRAVEVFVVFVQRGFVFEFFHT